MSFMGETGDVFEAGGSMQVKWEISDFFSLSHQEDSYYHSPLFGFSHPCFYLVLYPNGEQMRDSKGWIGLYLETALHSPVFTETVKGCMCIMKNEGVLPKQPMKDIKQEYTRRRRGCPKLVSRSELLQQRSLLVPSDVLTVICSFRTVVSPGMKEKEKLKDEGNTESVEEDDDDSSSDDDDEETTPSQRKSVKKLRKSLKNLLRNSEDFDVTLKVRGKEFRAHRVILRARSPVFQSMFTHDTIEKKTGEVAIDDCDPDAFPDFLDHVYTGNTMHVSPKNVFSLCTISDKYEMLELRKACLDFLREKLSVDLFCETVSLALLHDEKDLIELATKFFCQNADEITQSAKWLTFLEKNATVGNQLFRKALKMM